MLPQVSHGLKFIGRSCGTLNGRGELAQQAGKSQTKLVRKLRELFQPPIIAKQLKTVEYDGIWHLKSASMVMMQKIGDWTPKGAILEPELHNHDC